MYLWKGWGKYTSPVIIVPRIVLATRDLPHLRAATATSTSPSLVGRDGCSQRTENILADFGAGCWLHYEGTRCEVDDEEEDDDADDASLRARGEHEHERARGPTRAPRAEQLMRCDMIKLRRGGAAANRQTDGIMQQRGSIPSLAPSLPSLPVPSLPFPCTHRHLICVLRVVGSGKS